MNTHRDGREVKVCDGCFTVLPEDTPTRHLWSQPVHICSVEGNDEIPAPTCVYAAKRVFPRLPVASDFRL